MSEPIPQIHRTLTSRNERKELLVMACQVDRLAWREACRPVRAPVEGAQLAFKLAGWFQTLGAFLPGRVGRWLRGASILADLGRMFGWLRR